MLGVVLTSRLHVQHDAECYVNAGMSPEDGFALANLEHCGENYLSDSDKKELERLRALLDGHFQIPLLRFRK